VETENHQVVEVLVDGSNLINTTNISSPLDIMTGSVIKYVDMLICGERYIL